MSDNIHELNPNKLNPIVPEPSYQIRSHCIWFGKNKAGQTGCVKHNLKKDEFDHCKDWAGR